MRRIGSVRAGGISTRKTCVPNCSGAPKSTNWAFSVIALRLLSEFDAEFVRKLPQVMPGGEVRLVEGHIDRGRRLKLLQHSLQDSFDEGGVNLDFPNHDPDSLCALSNSERDVFKGDGPLARLLEALVGFG